MRKLCIPRCSQNFLAARRGNKRASPAQMPSTRRSKGSPRCSAAVPRAERTLPPTAYDSSQGSTVASFPFASTGKPASRPRSLPVLKIHGGTSLETSAGFSGEAASSPEELPGFSKMHFLKMHFSKMHFSKIL